MASNLSVALLAGTALLVAGCGGSTSAGVAHLPSSTSGGSAPADAGKSSPESSASQQQKLVAYSQCMRTHGVPEFPEPVEGHLLIRGAVHNGRPTAVNPGSTQFQTAQRACGKLLPSGGVPSPAEQAKVQESALKFSQCMRTHGVPSFPDPTFGGGGRVALKVTGGAGGIDPNSPQFKAAQKACQSILPRPLGAKGGPEGGGPPSTSGSGPGESAGNAVAVP
jgi:hypothetical protein